jgi:hypothetical protein
MVPHLVASPNGVSLIAQGAPIPAVQYNFSGVSLSTKKVALLVGFTRELFQSSNADALVRAMLAENLARLAWTAFCSMQPRATLRVRQVCATALLLCGRQGTSWDNRVSHSSALDQSNEAHIALSLRSALVEAKRRSVHPFRKTTMQ